MKTLFFLNKLLSISIAVACILIFIATGNKTNTVPKTAASVQSVPEQSSCLPASSALLPSSVPEQNSAVSSGSRQSPVISSSQSPQTISAPAHHHSNNSSNNFVSSSDSSSVSPPPPVPPLTTENKGAPAFVHPKRILTGYYGGWAAYGGFTPDKIKASDIDIINYAFAKIDTDLKVTASDADIDYSNFSKLKLLKKSYPSLKTVISIGGWNDSGEFSNAALTASSRSEFAQNAVSFMKAYGFDGVDIDWEYPTGNGECSNTERPSDAKNFGLLLGALRNRLDQQGIQDGRHYILSFAGAANSKFAKGVGLSGIAGVVDYGFIMTYDLHGDWDDYTDFNAPLYFPDGESPQYKASVNEAVNEWLACGFPANKLVLGVPFYGYAYSKAGSGNNGLWQSYDSAVSVGFDIIQNKYLTNTSFTRYYNAAAEIPWLFDGSTFVSYDDMDSIRLKAGYAMSKKLFGIGAWDLSYDHNSILVKTIKNIID